MYINSRHIRIAKFLINIEDLDFNTLKKILNISISTLNAYLKDIEYILTGKNSSKSNKDIANLIKSNANTIWLLKTNQNITKLEKIDFLMLMFLCKEKVNLTEAATLLDINRRSINYYLDEVNAILNKNNLYLINKNSSGLILDGDLNAKKNLIFGYTYKLLIEKNELPKNLRSIVANIIKNIDFINLKNIYKNTEYDNKFIHIDYNTFIAFYFSHYYLESKKLDSIDYFYSEFKNYILSSIDKENIAYLSFKSSIERELKINLNHEKIQEFQIIKWFWYNRLKYEFNIIDLNSFLSIMNNIPQEIKIFVFKMKIKFENFSFYEGINLYFILKNPTFIKIKQNYRDIFVYSSLSECMIISAKLKLENTYSFNFKKILNITELKNYLNNNKIGSIVTIENLNLERFNFDSIRKEQYIYIPLTSLL
ncbi:MAG: hypothetical protein ACRCZO_04075 [Cetobacterium sp.]